MEQETSQHTIDAEPSFVDNSEINKKKGDHLETQGVDTQAETQQAEAAATSSETSSEGDKEKPEEPVRRTHEEWRETFSQVFDKVLQEMAKKRETRKLQAESGTSLSMMQARSYLNGFDDAVSCIEKLKAELFV